MSSNRVLSLVVSWCVVNWRNVLNVVRSSLLMYGSIVMDGSIVVHDGFVVNWCLM